MKDFIYIVIAVIAGAFAFRFIARIKSEYCSP